MSHGSDGGAAVSPTCAARPGGARRGTAAAAAAARAVGLESPATCDAAPGREGAFTPGRAAQTLSSVPAGRAQAGAPREHIARHAAIPLRPAGAWGLRSAAPAAARRRRPPSRSRRRRPSTCLACPWVSTSASRTQTARVRRCRASTRPRGAPAGACHMRGVRRSAASCARAQLRRRRWPRGSGHQGVLPRREREVPGRRRDVAAYGVAEAWRHGSFVCAPQAFATRLSRAAWCTRSFCFKGRRGASHTRRAACSASRGCRRRRVRCCRTLACGAADAATRLRAEGRRCASART